MAVAQARVGFIFGETGVRVTWATRDSGATDASGRERIGLVVLDLSEGDRMLLPRTGHAAEGIMAASLMPDPKCPPAFSRDEARQLRDRLGEETLLALRQKGGNKKGPAEAGPQVPMKTRSVANL